jgi:hypothetical protein
MQVEEEKAKRKRDQPMCRKAMGETWAIMKFETQAAIEVMAVPRARIPVFMISTGYAQERGPMAEEKAKF